MRFSDSRLSGLPARTLFFLFLGASLVLSTPLNPGVFAQSAPPPPVTPENDTARAEVPAPAGQATPAPQTTPATPLQERLEQVCSDKDHQINGKPLYAAAHLMALYRLNGFQPLWNERERALVLREAVLASQNDGLVPDDYHLDVLNALLGEDRADEETATETAETEKPANGQENGADARPAATPRSDAETAKTAVPEKAEAAPPAPSTSYTPNLEQDILLSDALLLLGEHLLHGKASGRDVPEKKDMNKDVPEVDAAAYFKAVSEGTIRELVQAQTPQNPHYQALKNALVRQNSKTTQYTHVPEGPSIRPGMRGSRVRDLKKRLAESGELAATETADDLYDEALVNAVRKFQAAHALKADGTAGKRTIQALNGGDRLSKAQVQQIRANLERTRWLMHDQPDTAVLVDIAGYRLHFYQDGKPVWSTRVMVGKPFNQTPSFRSAINYLVVNPTWTVPPGMLRKEYVPKIMQNPDYLASTELKVYDRRGNQISPDGVNWSRCANRDCPYLLRQAPGQDNSLGRLKFMFPNPHQIYLHDTPSKSLFGRKKRALSHGCIRVDKPVELAHRLLEAVADKEKAVSVKYFDKVLNSGKNAGFPLAEPIPVFLFYATVKTDARGQLAFVGDIYGRDADIIRALDRAPRALRQKPPVPAEEPKAASPADTAANAGKADQTEKAPAQATPKAAPETPAVPAPDPNATEQTEPAAVPGKSDETGRQTAIHPQQPDKTP